MKYNITIKTEVEADSEEQAHLKAFENLESGKYDIEVEEE